MKEREVVPDRNEGPGPFLPAKRYNSASWKNRKGRNVPVKYLMETQPSLGGSHEKGTFRKPSTTPPPEVKEATAERSTK